MVSLDQFQYSAYNNDFGPLTINDLLIFASQMRIKQRQHTHLQVSTNSKQQARGICLLACYLLYQKGYSITKVVSLIGENTIASQQSFRDAGIGPADFPLTVNDVLRGLQLGIKYDWV